MFAIDNIFIEMTQVVISIMYIERAGVRGNQQPY
jgi:hypothetical protein